MGIIPQTFPTIGDHFINAVTKQTEFPQTGCIKHKTSDEKCSCPKRSNPPPVPTALPYPATEENVDKLKQWIINRYLSSTFNTCEEQELNKISGPPLEIDVDPSVKPSAVHTPLPVPVHWQKEVKAQLDRDQGYIYYILPPPLRGGKKYGF